MSLYTIVLHKFACVLVKAAWKLAKTAVIKAGAYIVSMDRETTIFGLEAGKIPSCP